MDKKNGRTSAYRETMRDIIKENTPSFLRNRSKDLDQLKIALEKSDWLAIQRFPQWRRIASAWKKTFKISNSG